MKKPRPYPARQGDAHETRASFVSTSLSLSELLLLDTLTKRLTCMTTLQADTLLADRGVDADGYHRVVDRLEHRGLIEAATRPLRETDAPTAPLATWRPLMPPPVFGPVLHTAKARRERTLSNLRLIAATPAAANLVGGEPGQLPALHTATHDAQVADVYLWMLRYLPTRARSWRSERLLAREMAKRSSAPRHWRQRRRLVTGALPDAVVTDGVMRTAIELVGEYSLQKLQKLHQTCEAAGWGYELW